jgi:hypothetical protein
MEQKEITWEGPFTWDYIENIKKSDLPDIPKVLNTEGIYIFTFRFNGGYVVYWPGVTYTRPLIERLQEHPPKFRTGQYNVLDIDCALKGERQVIWDGWPPKGKEREYKLKFKADEKNLEAAKNQLRATNIFVTGIPGKDSENQRLRKRIESSIANNLYNSKESWAKLIDKEMNVDYPIWTDHGEEPIEIKNICEHEIYGLPEILKLY